MSDCNVRLNGRSTPAPNDRWLVLLLLGLGLPIFLLGLGSPALYDPHESLYAEIAREMVVRGDWLTPHLNSTRYLDKPPLFYWLIAISYAVFGVSEFSARLPIALTGLGGVLVTWGIGRHLFDGRSGALAGLVLTTSVGYFVFSRQLLPDMVFAYFTTLSFYGFLRTGEADRARELWSLLAYLCLALAVMTKGFVGLFPLVVLATYGLLSGSFHTRRGLRSIWGGLLFILLIVPWHLIIGWQHEGYFWHYFANEHFLRFLGRRHPIDFISLPLPIFSLVLFLWLLPWSPYLALAIPYEKIAGLVFYTGQSIDLLRRKTPPEPSLPLKPTERFLLSETEFRQLWISSEKVYLVTDSFLDGDGILDQESTFVVMGQLGNRWVVSNRP